MKNSLIIAAACLSLMGCNAKDNSQAPAAETPEVSTEKTSAQILADVIAGSQRSDEEKARDVFRHPNETLMFFGVEPDMTVVEIWPGGGWYTNVIAPYLATDEGIYYGASFDPARSERAAAAVAAFKETYTDKKDVYGDVRMTILGGGNEIAPAGEADVVLTFRNVHNWMESENAEAYFQAFFNALKPGGVLGVVEHRTATPDADGSSGYVSEQTVKAFAVAAGFEFDSPSEINSNPKDTADHPFGVWTLPPVLRSSSFGNTANPDFDHSKYIAIGESDRMTLKFRKPIAADGALLE